MKAESPIRHIVPSIIALQLLIIGGMFALSMKPLVTGREVLLRIEGRDPRDVFRGNYVELDYAFSALSLDSIPHDLNPYQRLRRGDVLYLELERQGAFHEPAGVWMNAPDGKPFLRTRIVFISPQDAKGRRETGARLTLDAGIGSFFADPEKAQALEKRLMQRAGDSLLAPFARVMVDAGGTARIKSLEF